jgi:hypothetical protein
MLCLYSVSGGFELVLSPWDQVDAIERAVCLQKSLRAEANKSGIQYVLALRKEHGLPTDGLDPLSFEEEQIYAAYYTRALAAKSRKKWPPKVIATAVTFVKRFFLHHSCMEHEVSKVVCTCLYISGKVTFLPVTATSRVQTCPVSDF